MSSTSPREGMGNFYPMSVDNVGFLLERLGQDCAPLQYLRELTQNAKEAIQRTDEPGTIIWDVDWIMYDLDEVMKLCVVDTGDGMTGEQMIRLINQLSSSGTKQSFQANYGIGAKIAAATRNPAGVIYQSWREGQGYMIELRKDEEAGAYGLRQFELQDGSYSHYMPLDDHVKPPEIDSHGTKVILMGQRPDENTMHPPDPTPSASRWIAKYLNTRYFEFPDGISVKAREGWDFPRTDKDRNVLRTITGQKAYLDKHAKASGTHKLTGAKVHWWILKDESAISQNSGFIESGGHVAALYQNELYDRATSRSGTAQLQQFGILFGARRVVLYLDPAPENSDALTTNTARTTLLLNGEKLPWADWQHEFRQNMPKELDKFVRQQAASATERDHLKSIKDRLKGIMDLYKVSRYRPSPHGMYLADESAFVSAAETPGSGRKSKGSGGKGSRAGSGATGIKDQDRGNIYHLFEKADGPRTERSESDPFPVVKWVSLEEGTRTEDDMEDKAAKYLEDQNTLLINADFRVFADMIDRFCRNKEAGQGIDVRGLVRDVVHQWFEQALVETVIGIRQLKGSKEWGPDDISRALSEDALTAAVMQRYHVHNACKRELGSKLGKALSAQDD